MNHGYQHISKAAEFRLAVWFMEAGWEVFLPSVQARQTDFVVRIPSSEKLLAIEVKSKQLEALNEGQLQNRWRDGKAPFDYLVFIEGKRERGVIIPREFFRDRGRTTGFFKKDKENYSRGALRPMFEPFSFDLRGLDDWTRGKIFCERFLAIHQSPPPLPSIAASRRSTKNCVGADAESGRSN